MAKVRDHPTASWKTASFASEVFFWSVSVVKNTRLQIIQVFAHERTDPLPPSSRRRAA